jgi:hypothetical protein
MHIAKQNNIFWSHVLLTRVYLNFPQSVHHDRGRKFLIQYLFVAIYERFTKVTIFGIIKLYIIALTFWYDEQYYIYNLSA